MKWSDIPRNPTARTLRQFSVLWIVCFLSMAAWQGLVRDRAAVAVVIAITAITMGVLGLIKPAAVRPIFVAWMTAAFPIGWLVSHAMLGVLYFGLFTPLALFFRVVNRDALKLRKQAGAKSYWLVKPAPADVRSYFRQF